MQCSQLSIDVEMDCLTAVESLSEIKALLGERDCSIAHISSHQNVVSHRLTSFGRLEARTAVWLRFGPANVPQLCLEDPPSCLSNETPFNAAKNKVLEM